MQFARRQPQVAAGVAVCPGALSVHRAVPAQHRVRARVAGQRRHIRAQEARRWLVQGNAATHRANRVVPGQFRRGFLIVSKISGE